MSLEDVATKLKPILDEYLTQKLSIEKRITQEGVLPRSFCERCPNYSILEIRKFPEEQNKTIVELVEWIDRNEIRDLSSDGKTVLFSSSMKEVDVTGERAPLLSMLGEPERYDYAAPTDFFKKASFYPILKNQFKRLGICHHLESSSLRNSLPVLMTKRGYEIFFLRRCS